MSLYEASQREQRISSALRARAVAEIRRRGPEKVAASLGMMPTGVKSLLWEPHWSLETSFRVAEALGIEATCEMEKVSGAVLDA